jgi:hypothetical protein
MEPNTESIQKWLTEAKAEISKLKKESDGLREQARESSGRSKPDLEEAARDIDLRLIGLRIELARWRFKLEKALQRQDAHN